MGLPHPITRSPRRLGCRHVRQGPPHGLGLPGDHLEVGPGRLIWLAPVLLPIAQGTERDAERIGELGLRQAKVPADPLGDR